MIAERLANLKRGDNRFTIDAPIGASISQSDAAELLNVSRRSVQRAAEGRPAKTAQICAVSQ